MKIRQFIKKNQLFLIIFLIASIIRLIYLFDLHEIWWDSGTYVGMGKYLFSLGKIGLWETVRPPLLPIFLGLFWKLKLNILIIGRIFELLLSVSSIFLLYLIANKWYGQKNAVITSVLFSFSSIFFFMTFHLYNEILAIFLILLGIYLLTINRFFLAGFAVALAFLAKFPAGIFILALIIPLLFQKKLKNTAILAVGFAVPSGIYFIINYFVYGNPFLPFIAAHNTIKLVLGCNAFHYKPWWQYFVWVLNENPLHLFSIPGIILCIKNKKKNLTLALAFLLPLIYFTQLHCRDYRYVILFIPFVCIFTAIGINYFISILPKKKNIFVISFIIILVISMFYCISYYKVQTPRYISPAEQDYYRFLNDKYTEKEIWTTNPIHAIFSNQRLYKAYDPLFAEDGSTNLMKNIKSYPDKIGYVLIDNCGGGLICEKTDNICNKRLEATESFLENNFKLVYNKKHANCYYKIYKSTSLS